MAADNTGTGPLDRRTMAEKQRDDVGPTPMVLERVSLKDAMARDPIQQARRARGLECVGGDVLKVHGPDSFPRQGSGMTAGHVVNGASLGNGVPAEILAAAGGIGGNGVPPYQSPVVSGTGHNQFPVASPLTLIDQARNIQESLEHFARSLTGAAEWCEARAKELPPLEAHALLFTAKLLRGDAERCRGKANLLDSPAAELEGKAGQEAEGTACTTAP